jgi:hypothetical protein
MSDLKNFILCYFLGSNIFLKNIFKFFLIRSEIKFIIIIVDMLLW